MSADGERRRPRPVASVLDVLRARIDHDDFDVAVFALEAVVADLGYGDVRPLVGSIAWIDALREEGKRTAVVHTGESAEAALQIAGIADRFDVVGGGGGDASEALAGVLAELGSTAERAVVVDVVPEGLLAARGAGCRLAIGVARGAASPEALRRGGAVAVVADLQELLRAF